MLGDGGESGDGRCLLLWFTPVIQETEVQRVFFSSLKVRPMVSGRARMKARSTRLVLLISMIFKLVLIHYFISSSCKSYLLDREAFIIALMLLRNKRG